MAHKSEIYDAIEKLAEAMGVDVGIVIEAVEDGFKSAYKKYIRRNQVPTNISVAVTREHDIQVLARKVVSEEITDDLMQISLEEARKFSPEYQLGDILEIDVTPRDFGRDRKSTRLNSSHASKSRMPYH